MQHRYIIKNSGNEDETLHFRDGSSICLRPNETYSYESDGADPMMMPYMVSIDWGLLEMDPSEEVTMVGNSRHWSVRIPVYEPVVPGAWKKEGF
jgi:hypothetical protein